MESGNLAYIKAWLQRNFNMSQSDHLKGDVQSMTILKQIVIASMTVVPEHVVASLASVLPLARVVIARGADVNFSDGGWAPLQLAARSRGHECAAMCSLLIEAGADINKMTPAAQGPTVIQLRKQRTPLGIDLRIWLDVLSVPQKNKSLQAFAISSLPTYASVCDIFVVIAPPTMHQDTCIACDEGSYRARAWCRAEVMSCWARNGSETMYMCNGDTIERFDVNAEAWDVFGGGLTCCTRGHLDGDPCDKEALVLSMLGLFAELYENRHGDGKVVSLSSPVSTDGKTGDGAAECYSPVSPVPGRVLREHQSVSFAQLKPLATAARGRPSYATVEPLLERLYPRTFEWSRLAPQTARSLPRPHLSSVI